MGNRPWVPDLCGDETDVLLEKKHVYYGIVLPKKIPMLCGFLWWNHDRIQLRYLPSHRYQGWPEIRMVNSLLLLLKPLKTDCNDAANTISKHNCSLLGW